VATRVRLIEQGWQVGPERLDDAGIPMSKH
jgi:hypothetical protein